MRATLASHRCRRRRWAVVACFAAPLVVALPSCGSHKTVDANAPFDASGQFLLDAPVHPDASCFVEINTVPVQFGIHVAFDTEVIYSSNPPAGGPHYPIWAGFQEYAQPVDRRYWVHDLEHGAVVFLYKCEDAGACPDIVQGLRDAAQALPDDPICDHSIIRARYVITPDPFIDVPVAASAWGWTYRAACLDLPSLKAFALEHARQGPEDFCGQGQTTF